MQRNFMRIHFRPCAAFFISIAALAWIADVHAAGQTSPESGEAAAIKPVRSTRPRTVPEGLEAESAPASVCMSDESSHVTVQVAAAEDGAELGGPNDFCNAAIAIEGLGTFQFENLNALPQGDGPPHEACAANFGEPQIGRDVWFCWTAPAQPCASTTVISTCGSTSVDTKIALYEGCSCPPTDEGLIACRDDDCGTQTRIQFAAIANETYLIRLGSFPGRAGGAGSFSIACQDPPPCNEPGANCQLPDNTDALNADRVNFITADDFTPAVNGAVTELCWWGTYLDATRRDCEGLASDAFRVRYFANNQGQPGALLASFSQSLGTLTVQGAAATGSFINRELAEYAYHADHAPVNVQAGQCYWVEITNQLTDCSWFWEVSFTKNQRAMQDGVGDPLPPEPPNGYDLTDLIVNDLAFCTGLPLADSESCIPPPPPNDSCAGSFPRSGEGEFLFDNSSATQDGPAHTACANFSQNQIDHDVWYCWTSPCTGEVFVRTCNRTDVDTRIAVYDLCGCPATDARILACNDDLCDLASMVKFDAIAGRSYSIRVGTFPGAPGGTGHFSVTCGPPENPSCPGLGSCCAGEGALGCEDKTCCETVCACDPFCCSVAWDAECAGGGSTAGCGAEALCNCGAQCGSPTTGDCCEGHDTPFCNDAGCCETVCSCDPYCCDTEWDEFCATTGSEENCGAGILCAALCTPDCPVGTVQFANDNVVDARRPFNPAFPNVPQGITQISATGPTGADRQCWTLCETLVAGTANRVVSANETSPGIYTLMLSRPITAGAVTAISYTNNNSGVTTGHFTSHPANADGNGTSAPADVQGLVNALRGTQTLPWGLFSRDIDRSGTITPLDILEAIDLLNGAGTYNPWNGTLKPIAQPTCP